ncbi:CCA tRNA nucleotidyltransferase, partial [Thermodesulfobacteriota bacterium]
MFSKIKRYAKLVTNTGRKEPVVTSRKDHCISRRLIDRDALKVMYRLNQADFKAYLVGGGVRDLLLGRKPKDFDVTTDAHPREIKRLFRNCFLIGRRFRLAHIRFGDKIIETSTFRREAPHTPPPPGKSEAPVRKRENTFGTPEEDARMRDFTINGLFYDIRTFSVIDHVGGQNDLDSGLIRCIGDPRVRFPDDP